MGIIYRGTIAWAYVFSFPAGVIWGKIRNKEITPEKKKVVCILSFAFSALVVAYRYGKTHEGLEELFFTLLAAVGIITFFELINLEDFPIFVWQQLSKQFGTCLRKEKVQTK